MKCPYCGGEMEQGSIWGDRYAVKWRSGERQAGHLLGKHVRLTDPLNSFSHPGAYCEKCKKVIIDVSDTVKDESGEKSLRERLKGLWALG